MSLPHDLKHYHSRRRWHDGPLFLAALCAAAAAVYAFAVLVLSLA